MCGIVGYAGNGDAKNFLIQALKNLEYRGYDSAGIATINRNRIASIKRAGRAVSYTHLTLPTNREV